MSALASALEHELKGLNDEIARVSNEAQAKREEADNLVSEYRTKGVNVLVDEDAASAVEKAYLAADEPKNRLAVLNERRKQAMGGFSAAVPAPTVGGPQTIAERIRAAAGYEQAAQIALGAGQIGPLDLGQINDRDALIRSLRAGASGGGIFAAGADGSALAPIDQRLYPPVEIPVRRIRLLDLIGIGATDTDLVRYSKQTTRTDGAAPTAVGTGDSGTAYPEASYVWTTADASVRSIGQYTKAPRENLADVAALQTLIENQLATGVLLEAERQVFKGDGTGINFTGIKTQATSDGYTITRDTTNERRLIALHRAITTVRVNLFDEPDAIVISPSDYHDMIAEESTSGGFLMAAVSLAQEQPTLWGLPVVPTTLADDGEPWVGAFKSCATLWVREGASIRMTDSNEDDFKKRLIAILAEFRGAFAVQQSRGFCGVLDF